MKYLLKNATILDPGNKWHRKQKDILIGKGQILKISDSISDKDAKLISSKNLCVSQGWIDACADFSEPGNEHKEDLKSGLEAAKRGGFTAVSLATNTSPSVDSKAQIEFLLSKSENTHVDILPKGSISAANKGEQLSEMFDMEQAGAKAFSDSAPIENSELLKLALLYSKNLKSKIIDHPMDSSLAKGGQINEGAISTSLGIKGIPDVSELLRVNRNLEIANYCESELHFELVSNPEALAKIKKASKALKHSVSVPLANLVWSDDVLVDFDTNFKVMPPLRTKSSVKKLRKMVLDGDANIIASNHKAQDVESKRCEFDYAEFGMASLEVFIQLLNQAFGDQMTSDEIISAITLGPRELFGIEQTPIEEGQNLNLSLFDPSLDADLDEMKFASKAVNYPLSSIEGKGKIIGSFNGKSSYLAS